MQQDIRTTPKRAVDRHSSAALLIGLFVFVALAALAFGAWTFLFSAPIGPLDPLAPATTHAKGGSGAPVAVVVFGDYQCRACASFVLDVQPAIESDFVDEGIVRYVYRHYPTLGRESLRAAQASECVGRQGKFWDYHTVLYRWQGSANVGNFSDEILEQLGLGVRLNPHEYWACMGESVTGSMVEDDLTQAASLGIETLPAVFVNGLRVDDPVDYAPLRLHIAAAAAGG